jgi:hypothetical protein
MIDGYNTKDMKAKTKKEVLPIYRKKQHWCFKLEGQTHKFPTEEAAKSQYKKLIK